MNISQILGWMQIVQIAVPLGMATVAQIESFIRAAHGSTMTDQELNVVIALVMDDATRRKALAIADALGTTAAA